MMVLSKLVVGCLVQRVMTVRVAASNVHSVDDTSSERIAVEESSSIDREDEIIRLNAEINRLKEENNKLKNNETNLQAVISKQQQEIKFLKTQNEKLLNDKQHGEFNINSEGVYSDGSATAMKAPMSEVPSMNMSAQQIASALNTGNVAAGQVENSSEDVYLLGNYIAEKKPLGEGGFGLVLKGYLKGKENEQVAIKVLKTAEPRMQAAAKQEFDMLTKIDHKHVIKCVDSFYHNGVFCAVSEFANEGDLRQLIEKQGETKWKPTEVHNYFTQISYGMAFLHDQKIMHRDLKPANIVVFRAETGELVMKIADFGLAKEFGDNKESSISRVGTEVYMSPEMLNRAKYSYANDVWALGCILFELCLLKRVFEKIEDIFNKDTRKTKLEGISNIATAATTIPNIATAATTIPNIDIATSTISNIATVTTSIFSTNKDQTHWTELSNVCKQCLDSDAKNRLSCLELYGRMMHIDMKAKAKKSYFAITTKGAGIDDDELSAVMMFGDVIMLKSLLTIDGVDVNRMDSDGRTAVMQAAGFNKNYAYVIQELLKRKDVDVNKQDTRGFTALIIAVDKNNVDFVKELLKREDVDVNKQDSFGRTALIIAVDNNKVDVVKELLKREDVDVNKKQDGGNTALTIAVTNKGNNVDVMKELLKREDVDVNKQYYHGTTALMFAVADNSVDALKELLKREDIDTSIKDEDGKTALDQAQEKGHKEIITLLTNK